MNLDGSLVLNSPQMHQKIVDLRWAFVRMQQLNGHVQPKDT